MVMKNVSNKPFTEKLVDSIFDGIFIATFFIIAIVFEVIEFAKKMKLEKIDDVEINEDKILFKKGKKVLFKLEKYSKYSIGIDDDVVTLGYFGCALKNDCHKFRATKKVVLKAKEILHKSAFSYEKGMYRF